MTNEEYRIVVAVKAVNIFRDALAANGNQYHGGLVPNLTTITDVLTIPINVLIEQVSLWPEMHQHVTEWIARTRGENAR